MFNEYEVSKARKASIARFVALVIVILNAVLSLLGFPVIPTEYGDAISAALVAIVGIYAGFKNNYLTKFGKKQAEELAKADALKKK